MAYTLCVVHQLLLAERSLRKPPAIPGCGLVGCPAPSSLQDSQSACVQLRQAVTLGSWHSPSNAARKAAPSAQGCASGVPSPNPCNNAVGAGRRSASCRKPGRGRAFCTSNCPAKDVRWSENRAMQGMARREVITVQGITAYARKSESDPRQQHPWRCHSVPDLAASYSRLSSVAVRSLSC